MDFHDERGAAAATPTGDQPIAGESRHERRYFDRVDVDRLRAGDQL
jgi:hypothetical protein